MTKLAEYRSVIGLDAPRSVNPDPQWAQSLSGVLADLGVNTAADATTEQLVQALHGLLATVDEHVLDEAIVDRIEAIAAGIRSQHDLPHAAALPTIASELETRFPAAARVSLWIGDITLLQADAIVNAANDRMLGCRIPNHRCIDNSIHSAAGPRLRDDCATVMSLQATLEPVGTAKITIGHALAAPYVVHTVGPQLHPGATPTDDERAQLAQCYRSCLDVAAEIAQISTLAFCSISTGVFSFPAEPAARIALHTIAEWVDNDPDRFERVVIDCFTAADADIYRAALRAW